MKEITIDGIKFVSKKDSDDAVKSASKGKQTYLQEKNVLGGMFMETK